MTMSEALSVGQSGMLAIFWAAGPLLILGMLVGLVVSLVQAITQLHEVTIPFVAKILAMSVGLLFLGPFTLAILTDLMRHNLGDFKPFIH